ncbi:PAS domain-containing protein [Methylobacterium sp. J-076]|uniref:PAS domain-containing protein n=1 Tax=Methylobacterium sp. J-076 TaxID=2836655 RepID=UPI001FB9DE9F|nr:PAS domain-containing protein [Methylobacterium sp. J-076]MCJ2014163.1 PAS domain S-box protein [Methylobacterium sp. J-076]
MTASSSDPGLVEAPDRLAALAGYDILDTEPERGFDDIVALACQFCRTPVALVSLVAKDRQWFKARIGFDPCETPLSQSVCAHALGLDDLLVIPDLTLDLRTADNALVTGEPHLRFYAGAPLHSPEGAVLGTLCVIDHEPRPEGLTDDQREALRTLARQVMVQMELHRAIENRGQALAAKGQAEEQLRLATAAGGIGVWDLDLVTGELRWDRRVRELFGVPERGLVTYEGSFLANLHPEDRGPADAAVQAALDPAGSLEFDIEYRTVSAETGVTRWVAARGQAIVEDGKAVRFIGTVRDVTVRKTALATLSETEERYRLAARATNDAIWDWDLATNHVRWNAALEAAYGHASDGVRPTGDWWIEHIHPDDRPRIDASIHAVIEGSGSAWTDTYRFLRADGEYAEILDRGYVIRDTNGGASRMIGAMLDLTDLRATERALRESERQLVLERSLLRSVFKQAPVGISVTDAASGWTTLVNDRAQAMIGLGVGGHPDALREGHGAQRADGTSYEAADYPTARTLRRGETVHAELLRHRDASTGEVRRFEVSSAPVRGDDGTLVAAVTILVDVEDRLRAETQAARLAAIVEQSDDFIGIADADGRGEYINPAGRRLIGLEDGEAAGAFHVRDFFVPEDLPYVEESIIPAVVAGRTWAGDFKFRNLRTGEPVPVHYNQFSLRGPGGEFAGFATVSRDIADRKRAEALQDLLNHELSHRMKNLLAMVQAVASSTLRGAGDVEAAREVLGGRLVALGNAHDILLGGAAVSASLEAVVRQGVGVHGRSGQVTFSGADVPIGGRAAMSLALTLHELTTNAVKYGALSVPEGHVAVTATVVEAADGPLLRIVWEERDGPPVAPPTHKGFGSRLIERGLTVQVGGCLRSDFRFDGLTCTVEAPLVNFQSSD